MHEYLQNLRLSLGCAINLSHIDKTFDDAALREIVNTISNGRDCLLGIVNFNVEVH